MRTNEQHPKMKWHNVGVSYIICIRDFIFVLQEKLLLFLHYYYFISRAIPDYINVSIVLNILNHFSSDSMWLLSLASFHYLQIIIIK